MFGATNKTITKIYAITYNDYGSPVIGTETILNLKCWFESTYKEYRKPNGDIYIVDTLAILPKNDILQEGSIIEIDSKNYKIETINNLEDFSSNKRIELSLKLEV